MKGDSQWFKPDLKVYLASPRTQQQAEHAGGFPVLLSYATWAPWLGNGYVQSFGPLLLDSGAFSELSGNAKVDLQAYLAWVNEFDGQADAYAGLDDIGGDWRRSLKNYEAGGFPTFHDTDPPELLDDLLDIAKHRGGWIGIGLLPPRRGKGHFIRKTLDRIPEGFHVHGWALREYTYFRRLDSVDSTNWWRSAMELRARSRYALTWLTYGECLDLQIKRIVRQTRTGGPTPDVHKEQLELWPTETL